MHMVIYAVVPAPSRAEALNVADEVFSGLCGDGEVFDYYTKFDAPGSTVSGNTRWGNKPGAAKLDTLAGKTMLKQAMDNTIEDFNRTLDKIRAAMPYTNAEIMEERPSDPNAPAINPLSMIRYYMRCAGDNQGPDIHLYSKDGAGINTQVMLARVLNNYNEPLPDGEALWIVPADVHY